MARFVLPQELGNAAAMYVMRPSGSSRPRMSMCSASQPWRRPSELAIRRAKHFLGRRALPP